MKIPNLKLDKIIPLVNRSILRIKGVKCDDFLQKLITNDIKKLTTKNLLYTLFLSPKGKVCHDLFLFRFQTPNEFFIDCDIKTSQNLKANIEKYDIFDKFNILDFSSRFEIAAISEKSDEFDFTFEDPRSKTLKKRTYRFLPKKNFKIIDLNEEMSSTHFDPADKEDKYRLFCLLNGIIGENGEIRENSYFPTALNMDKFNAISVDKGCYVGQENTERARSLGVYRKRTIPMVVVDPESEIVNLLKEKRYLTPEETISAINFDQKNDLQFKRENVFVRTKKGLKTAGKVVGLPENGNVFAVMLEYCYINEPLYSARNGKRLLPIIPDYLTDQN